MMTAEIVKKLPKLYATEQVATAEKRIIFKLFCPWSNWTWFIVEGGLQADGDWLFFGLVDGLEREFGYFSLNELMSITGPGGLKIERDLYFGSPLVKECKECQDIV
jgi:hypothetical protein